MKERVSVRHASEDDLDFVAQDRYLTEAVVLRKIKDDDVFIAFRGEQPIGYVRLERLWSRLPYIELIRVLEPHRRAGVGAALLAYALAETEARGFDALYSSSQADEAEPQAWHRRMGFEECGFLAGINGDGVGEVFFRKRIQAL